MSISPPRIVRCRCLTQRSNWGSVEEQTRWAARLASLVPGFHRAVHRQDRKRLPKRRAGYAASPAGLHSRIHRGREVAGGDALKAAPEHRLVRSGGRAFFDASRVANNPSRHHGARRSRRWPQAATASHRRIAAAPAAASDSFATPPWTPPVMRRTILVAGTTEEEVL